MTTLDQMKEKAKKLDQEYVAYELPKERENCLLKALIETWNEAIEEAEGIRVAGNDLAKITECFCDDLTAYQGTCETCLWKANEEEFKKLKFQMKED